MRFITWGERSLLRSCLCRNREMQIGWGRFSLQQLRCSLQHLLSSQLVSQNNMAKNSCLKLKFVCKILLPLTQNLSNFNKHRSSPRTGQSSSDVFRLLKQLHCLAGRQNFASILPSSQEVLLSLIRLCDYFLKGSSVDNYLFSHAKSFVLWTLWNRDSVVDMIVVWHSTMLVCHQSSRELW